MDWHIFLINQTLRAFICAKQVGKKRGKVWFIKKSRRFHFPTILVFMFEKGPCICKFEKEGWVKTEKLFLNALNYSHGKTQHLSYLGILSWKCGNLFGCLQDLLFDEKCAYLISCYVFHEVFEINEISSLKLLYNFRARPFWLCSNFGLRSN